ncbi:MAG: efflux RND transporter periplasmic adaptor subunit [Gammaproteobacteria bacterium]|nr:efflux RND transporter periplasmic adaptor subunit [Gammaproteobacteria bacterium]
MRKLRTICLLLSNVFTFPVLYAAEDIPMSVEQAQSLDIATASLRKQEAEVAAGLPAQVVIPNSQMHIVSAPVAGFVESMRVAVNEQVKQDQILARLESPTLIEAQRTFLQAVTRAALRRENLGRDEKLFKDGIIAGSRYLMTKNEFTEASAELAERQQLLSLYGMSKAAIQQLRDQRILTSAVEIVSPMDGVVLEQLAVAGQRTEASAPLYKLASLSPLWLEVAVPLSRLAQINEGSKITVPAYQAVGKVLSVGRSVDSANQTVMVRAEVTEGAQRLRPGQQIEVMIAAPDTVTQQWAVPNQALVRQQGQVYVFVQTPSGFRAQAVTVVSAEAETSTVQAPLRGDERIAVRGVVALKGAWQGLGGGE